MALALLGAIAAGSAWLLRERISPRTPQTPPAAALEEASAGQAAGPALPRSSLREGPASLQERLDTIAARHGEPIGIAVADVGAGWAVAVAGDHFFPQQSVSKTWVALAVLDAVDRGDLDLKSAVTMTFADRSVFNQPLG
ncbi:serine hydrolase, partial [Phenylobacterium sp.]